MKISLPKRWKKGRRVAFLLIALLQLHLVTTAISSDADQQRPPAGTTTTPNSASPTAAPATVPTSGNNQAEHADQPSQPPKPTTDQTEQTAAAAPAASSASESKGSSEQQQQQQPQQEPEPETESLGGEDDDDDGEGDEVVSSKDLEDPTAASLLDQELNTAKQHFYGEELEMNLNLSYQLFSALAAKGNAEAHLVSISSL